MALTVDKWSPFMSLQKEEMAKQAGVKKWEDIFLQPYETAAQNVQKQAAYDISGAFAQYKKSELNALRNTQLGSGFKEQIASDLANQYTSAFSQIKQQEASDIYGIQQQASETLASAEEQLQEKAKMYAGIEAAVLEQHGVDLERARTSEQGVVGKDDEGKDVYGLGYYEVQPDGSYKITARGIDFFDKAFNKGFELTDEQGVPTGEYQSVVDYLKQYGDDELVDFYLQNYDTSKQFIGGLSAGDMSWSPEERQYALDFNDVYTANSSVLETLKNSEVFATNKARLDAAEKVLTLSKANSPDTPDLYKEIINDQIDNNSDWTSLRGFDNEGFEYTEDKALQQDIKDAKLLSDYYTRKTYDDFKTEKDVLDYLARVESASERLAHKYWWKLYKKLK